MNTPGTINTINRKALAVFLSVTFGVTIALVVAARLAGFTFFGQPIYLSQIAILAAMFVPALAALVTQKFVARRPLRELGFRFGPWKMYAKVYALIVAVFAVNYAITWAFFLKPDFTLDSFINQFPGLQPNLVLPIPAWQMVLAFAALTFIGAPFFNLIPSLGEEIGWRGFLLPALEPLGRAKAMVVSGVIWALWHTPMILLLGFLYGKDFWLGALLHFTIVASLGVWMGHIWFKTKSVVLAAFIHAVFNANVYGVWSMVFVPQNKLAIGGIGLVMALLLLAVAVVTLYANKRETAPGAVK